jgi:hypothetical protein
MIVVADILDTACWKHLAHPVYLAEECNPIWSRGKDMDPKRYIAYDYCDQVMITVESSFLW